MPAAVLPCSSVHPSTLGMSEGELGLLSIPSGDQKFGESSPTAQNPCLGLLKEVSSLELSTALCQGAATLPACWWSHGGKHHLPCFMQILPAQLKQGKKGPGRTRWTDLLAGLEAATSPGKVLQSRSAAGA